MIWGEELHGKMGRSCGIRDEVFSPFEVTVFFLMQALPT